VEGDELRRIRKRLKVTQAELGARVGVTRNTIARQERGELGIGEPLARLVRLLATIRAKARPRKRGR